MPGSKIVGLSTIYLYLSLNLVSQWIWDSYWEKLLFIIICKQTHNNYFFLPSLKWENICPMGKVDNCLYGLCLIPYAYAINLYVCHYMHIYTKNNLIYMLLYRHLCMYEHIYIYIHTQLTNIHSYPLLLQKTCIFFSLLYKVPDQSLTYPKFTCSCCYACY